MGVPPRGCGAADGRHGCALCLASGLAAFVSAPSSPLEQLHAAHGGAAPALAIDGFLCRESQLPLPCDRIAGSQNRAPPRTSPCLLLSQAGPGPSPSAATSPARHETYCLPLAPKPLPFSPRPLTAHDNPRPPPARVPFFCRSTPPSTRPTSARGPACAARRTSIASSASTGGRSTSWRRVHDCPIIYYSMIGSMIGGVYLIRRDWSSTRACSTRASSRSFLTSSSASFHTSFVSFLPACCVSRALSAPLRGVLGCGSAACVAAACGLARAPRLPQRLASRADTPLCGPSPLVSLSLSYLSLFSQRAGGEGIQRGAAGPDVQRAEQVARARSTAYVPLIRTDTVPSTES